jgi:hypothetical protein
MTPGIVAANQVGVSSHAGSVPSKITIQGRNTEAPQIQAHRDRMRFCGPQEHPHNFAWGDDDGRTLDL